MDNLYKLSSNSQTIMYTVKARARIDDVSSALSFLANVASFFDSTYGDRI